MVRRPDPAVSWSVGVWIHTDQAALARRCPKAHTTWSRQMVPMAQSGRLSRRQSGRLGGKGRGVNAGRLLKDEFIGGEWCCNSEGRIPHGLAGGPAKA